MKSTTLTTYDRFGNVHINGRPSPHALKSLGRAFGWQLRSGEYRAWIPRSGWTITGSRDEVQEDVYCYNHDC